MVLNLNPWKPAKLTAKDESLKLKSGEVVRFVKMDREDCLSLKKKKKWISLKAGWGRSAGKTSREGWAAGDPAGGKVLLTSRDRPVLALIKERVLRDSPQNRV